MTDKILSFYDLTGVALEPWAENGYQCYAFDIQHPDFKEPRVFPSGGAIHYIKADLHDVNTWHELLWKHQFKDDVALVMGWPVCTDLAVSGAKHWAKKAEVNPNFQLDAVRHAKRIAEFANWIDAPYLIENPVGRLSTLWRKPDIYFHPYQFGGYLSEAEAVHPTYPDHIAPRDAYFKKTGLWVGNGFVIPELRPVDPDARDKFGMSKQFAKLGGKSLKTKNIRSATPRGLAKAIFAANGFPLYPWACASA